MSTPYNTPYKVLQRKAKAHRQSRGRVLWTSCEVDFTLPGIPVKTTVQGTYRRGK